MQGLTIIVAGSDPERFEAALSVAAANSVLGRRSRIFLQGEATALLVRQDGARRKVGAPSLAELIGEATAVGVEIIACQSGLALAGLNADSLPSGVTTSGLVEILATRGDDQLMMA
jgi:predicted peroxiredoxin